MLTRIGAAGTLVSFNVGALLGVVTAFFHAYVFNDWNFAASLMVLVAVDTMTGVWASLVLREHNSRKLRQLFSKLVQFGAALIVAHVMRSYQVAGESSTLFSLVAPAFQGGIYLTLLWSEVISVEENLNKIGRGFLPSWIRKRMAGWMETGVIPDLKTETKVTQTPTETKVEQTVTVATPAPSTPTEL